MPQQQLSLLGKLDILLGVFSILAAGLTAVFTGLWRSERDAPTYYLHIAYAIMRQTTARYSVAQMQWVLPSTDKVYKQYTHSRGEKPKSVDLVAGAKGHWVGDQNSENVLIWYHGGGFVMPAVPAFFEFWEGLIASAQAQGKSLAIFALSYTLAPEAKYPTQLTQAVEALRYITLQKAPRSVLIGGDSAGANLTMGVLLHLTHPHPAIAPLKLAEPLAGAVLLAFPASMDASLAEEPSIYTGGDIVMPREIIKWLPNYFGESKRDSYTDPIEAPPSWFQKLPVRKILVLAGGHEVFKPLMDAFVERVTPFFPSIELFVGKREGHVAPVYHIFAGVRKETEQGKRLKAWIKEVL